MKKTNLYTLKVTFAFDKIEKVKYSKTYFLLFVAQIKGCYGVIRIEEKTKVCAIPRKLIFG